MDKRESEAPADYLFGPLIKFGVAKCYDQVFYYRGGHTSLNETRRRMSNAQIGCSGTQQDGNVTTYILAKGAYV